MRPSLAVFAPLLLVAIAIAFNLFVLRAEVRGVAAPNDTGVHISMVHWAEQRLSHGQLVFDGWYPRLSFGVAQFHHYQSLAPIVGGAIAIIFGAARTVAWSNYLLVSLWPLCIYWAVRLFGFHRWIAGITALVSPLVSSVTLYGFEHGSFQWRGNGIWTALWGMWLLPLALAFSWRAVSRQGIRARRAVRRAHHHRALPHRLSRPACDTPLGDHQAERMAASPGARQSSASGARSLPRG